jgi:hypothetical protein
MNLNLFQESITSRHHFSLITSIRNVTGVVKCEDCGKFISEYKKLKQHQIVCTGGVPKIEFVGGIYEPKNTIFQQLDQEGIIVENDLRYYPFFIFYDFECWLDTSCTTMDSKLQFEGVHQLLSISILGSHDTTPKFIPVETTPLEAIKQMLKEMESIRLRYIQQLHPKYTIYYKKISRLDDEKKRKSLQNRLSDWIEEMPVYGFNSGKYDLNVIKVYLPILLREQGKKFGNVSKKEKEWLQTVENEKGIELHHNFNIDKYKVDGFDKNNKTVYEYYGCIFHGCPTCYLPSDINPLTGDTMSVLLNKTMKKETRLKELGFNVVSKWDCSFQSPKGMELKGIIKQNNCYRMISNGKFSFKDIIAFVSPNTSLEQFLRAFNTLVPKGQFCHRLTQNIPEYLREYPGLGHFKNNPIQLLKESPIPAKKWFYNELKHQTISQEMYLHIKQKYSNVYDLLLDYNNQDTIPSVEATLKLSQFFKDNRLDIHKDGISISGLSLKYLWQLKDKTSDFHLFKGNEELYYKYRENLVGGPSIVFNHYQEKDNTKIRGNKFCKAITGYDANALYLYCIGQDQLVGEHQVIEDYPELLDDIRQDKFFGVVECDLSVPSRLKEYFSEMQPIFKNETISYKDLSHDTKKQVNPNYKSSKLIGSFLGKKMLFRSDLLKWYLLKGLEVSNITLIVEYERKAPFKQFVNKVSDARRQGDVSQEYKLIGEMMKLIGNSAYGKTLTNFLKHERVSIVSEDKFAKNAKLINYKTHQDLYQGYEFRFSKSQHKQDLPIQIGFSVYQLAKLRMLEFYFDFLDMYFDRSDFQLTQMDTDSMYVAFSNEDIESLVKPELYHHYQTNKHLWFGRTDTFENMMYDKRTPGLFKLEYSGDGIIALSSKMYYCFGTKDKFSSKGLNSKQNQLTKERYLQALQGDSTQKFANKGFRVKGNQMNTYTLEKTGMKLFNDKRKREGFDTSPIDI